MHSKKIALNSLIGILYKVLILLLNFISRKLFIVYMGQELLGLNSLFTDLLNFLNLADLGIGVSIQFILYEPIAKKNQKKIISIVNIAKQVFNTIGIFITVAGVILSFFLKYLIAENPYNSQFLQIVFILNVLSISLTYFIAHKKIFLQSKEEIYIINIVEILTQVVGMLLKIFIIVVLKNYYLYVLVSIICVVISNTIIKVTCDHKYPYLNNKGFDKNDRKIIFRDLKDVIPLKLGTYLYSSTDNVIISSFLGLAQVAAYSNYMLIINAIMQFSYMIAEAFKVSFGNIAHEKDGSKKMVKYFNEYFSIQYLFSSFCGVSLFCLLNPFIELFFGEQFLLPMVIVTLLVCDYFIHSLYQPLSMVFGALGKFKEDKVITLGIDVVNVVLSLLLVKPLGLAGPIIGTLISNTVTWFFRVYQIVYKEFKMQVVPFVIRILSYGCCFGLLVFVTYSICINISVIGLVGFILKTLVCLIIPNISNYLIWSKTKNFVDIKQRINNMRKW